MKSSRIVTMLGAMAFCLAAGAASGDGRAFETRAERDAYAKEAKIAEQALEAKRNADFEAALPARLALVNSVIDQFRAEFPGDENGMRRLSQFAAQVHSTPSKVLTKARFARNVADFAGQTERILPKSLIAKDQLGDQENLVFFPVGPCRIADSRFSTGGVLQNGVIRTYRNYSAVGQGGAANCNFAPNGIATGTPGSIALNIAGTSITGTGNLNVRPAGSTAVTSSLNFQPGQDISNATVIKMAGGGAFVPDFEILPTVNGAPGTIHVVIDLLGFYVPNEPAPLDCVSTTLTGGTTGTSPGSETTAFAPACAAGYTRVSLTCEEDNDAILTDVNVTSGYCSYAPRTATATTFSVGARCCRVPGNSTGRF